MTILDATTMKAPLKVGGFVWNGETASLAAWVEDVRKQEREKALLDAANLVSSITTEMTASEVAEAIRRLA